MLLRVRFISVLEIVTVRLRSHFLHKQKLCVELEIPVVFHKFTLDTCVNHLKYHYHEKYCAYLCAQAFALIFSGCGTFVFF